MRSRAPVDRIRHDIPERNDLLTNDFFKHLKNIITDESNSIGGVDVIDYTSDQIRIHTSVTTPEDAWIVYADAYHPSWRATVDGQEVQIVRVNLAFKAVKLTPGAHEVVFTFGTWKDTFLSSFSWYFGALWIVGLSAWILSKLIYLENCS